VWVEADPHAPHHRPLLVAAPEPVHRRSSSSVEVAHKQEVVLHVLVGHDMARHIIGEVEESIVLGGVRVHEHVAKRAREAAVPGVDTSSSSVTGGRLVQQRDGAGGDRGAGQDPGDVQCPGGRRRVGQRDGMVRCCCR
jgi:hypothetical protein